MRRAIGPTLALVCALAASCAYYNVFWTAEREYAAATAGNTFAEFSDPYAQQKPTGDNLKNVESCLRRCGKILLLYPKSKWVDDSLVLMGNCFVLKGEYTNALRKYEELLRFYPSSEFADEARYMKAYTQVLDGQTDEALQWLESPAGQGIARQWQDRSTFLRAKIYEHKEDCAQVIALLQDYLIKFPGGHRAHEASLALGHCLIKEGRPGEAVSVLEPLLARQDQAGATAAVRLSRAYRDLGQPDKAVEVLDGLLKIATVDSLKARARIEKALTLDGQGKPQEAIDVLSPADSLSKVSLGPEAKYRAGLIYEKSLGDFDKAVAAYDDVSRGTTAFSKAAQKRANALKAVKTYQQALLDSTATTASLAETRFGLAETYLLDLEMPARAEEHYRALTDSLPTNQFTARSMLVLGSLLEARGDSTAGSYYQAVIDSFPNTIQANIARAWFDLPLIDVVTEPPDTVLVGPPSPGAEEPVLVGPPSPGEEEPMLVGPPSPDAEDSLAGDSTLADSLSSRAPRTMVGPEGPPGDLGAPEDSLGLEKPPVRTRPRGAWPPQGGTPPPSETTPSPESGGQPGDEESGGDSPADTSGSPTDSLGSPLDSTFVPPPGRSDQ